MKRWYSYRVMATSVFQTVVFEHTRTRQVAREVKKTYGPYFQTPIATHGPQVGQAERYKLYIEQLVYEGEQLVNVVVIR